MDFGPHMLDLLRDWLGPLQLREYLEDAACNVEAECLLKLSSPACEKVELHLSRLRSMSNQILIEGTAAKLELKTFAPDQLKLTAKGGLSFNLDIQESLPEAAERQLQAFEATIRDGTGPLVSSSQGLETVALINQCYEQAEPLQHCWEKSLV